jgi:hypothetical protein
VIAQRMTDRDFLLRFGDMLSDQEIGRMLDRLSIEDRDHVFDRCRWLAQGPPWEGHVIQGTLEIHFTLKGDRHGTQE